MRYKIRALQGSLPRRYGGSRNRQSINRQLKTIKHRISKISVSREIKEITALPHTTFGTYGNTGDTRVVTLIPEGLDYNQREGRQVIPTSLAIDFFLRGPQSNVGTAGTFTSPVNPVPYRIIVVQDMSYQGTTRDIADVLEATNMVANNNYDNYISGYNDDNVAVNKHTKDNPIRILMDKRGWFVGTASGYSSHIGQWVKCRVSGSKLKPVQFNGALASNGRSGAIYYYVLLGADNVYTINNGSYLVRSTFKYYDD